MKIKAALAIAGFFIVTQTAFSQTVRPLSDIFLNLGGRSKAKVEEIAALQATQQWKMDRGPLYKSTPEINNDRNKVVDEVIFDGFFIAKSANSKLALFSDDGCDMFVDGAKVLPNYSVGQHLPTLKQSLHFINFSFVPGQTYHIKVRYSNTIFLGPTDIDGCTLFAFQGGGAMPEASISTDLNRDGKVNNDDDTAKLKLEFGTILIRNKDKVYGDAKEPARRREVKVALKGGAKGKIVIERGADKDKLKDIKGAEEKLKSNLQLFDKKAEGKELFGKIDSVTLEPGTYWLQGGAEASAVVRDQFLKVRLDQPKAVAADRINATVLWVDLDVSADPSEPMPTQDIYTGYDEIFKQTGLKNLGVHRTAFGSTADGPYAARGIIRFTGVISPKTYDYGNVPTGFRGGGGTKEGFPARADFGFVFRRFVSYRWYNFGSSEPFGKEDDHLDDNGLPFQDVKPRFNKAKDRLFITDVDAPSCPVNSDFHSTHIRDNFVEYVVFNWEPKTPERTSEKVLWAFSADVHMGTLLEGLFIFEPPNQKDGKTNILKIGSNLKSLDVGVSKASIKEAYHKDVNNKTLKFKELSGLTVKGENLIGRAYLIKDKVKLTGDAQAVETDPKTSFSDLKQLKVVFEPSKEKGAKGKGFGLFIENAAGKSNIIDGFEIVD